MKEQETFKKVIFGFHEKEVGNKLRVFFKKHTGRDVDFNSIEHYKNGLKLLLFSVPLDTVDLIGISAAGCTPSYVKKIHGPVDEFISWYEDEYLPSRKETTSNHQRDEINTSAKSNVFKVAMVTAVLSNGLSVRIPAENSSEIIRQMEENIKYNKNKVKK